MTEVRPLKQEQEPASDEVTEVAPGVLRLQLPIQMPGLGHVNTYALIDKRGAALVDPGMPGPANWKALRQQLHKADLGVKDVHTVIITHSHPDHFGGAARLAKESGAQVVTHEAFQTLWYDSDHDHDDSSDADVKAGDDDVDFEALNAKGATGSVTRRKPWDSSAWGGGEFKPPGMKGLMFRFAQPLMKRRFQVPEANRKLCNGDVINLAGREWIAVHTPGHTLDHLCLWDPTEGVFLSGDHVLPTITPHIAGLGEGADTLALFVSSLDRVTEIEGVKHVLPAHGHPFVDLAGRANEIRCHHDARMDKLREVSIELGPASVQDLTQRIFRPERWGFMAESEIFAHMRHLELTGQADRIEGDDAPLFVITADQPKNVPSH
ncbi:MAG: MBL fold metallo-hydrolase [Acidimicrobiales bacterium]